MKSKFIDVRDREWNAMLEKSNNEFYQLPSYLELEAQLTKTIAKAY